MVGVEGVEAAERKHRVLLIHGWNVRDRGEGSVGRLRPPLERRGYEVEQLGYGWTVTYFQTKQRSRRFAMTVAPAMREGDIIVAHSNGCRIALEISQRVCCDLGPMVWLHPALDRSMVPSCRVPRLLVVHSGRDWATRLAHLVPFSPWGDMGTRGYQSEPWSTLDPDPRIVNVEDGLLHSGWARHPSRTARMIDRFVRSEEARW